MRPQGDLVCVGVGMTLGAHISARCRDIIEQSDVVFALVSNGVVEQWIDGMNRDVRSLQSHYAEGKSRRETYREMIEIMLTEVRAGKRVCGAFYGHPGVFAHVPHEVIRRCRQEGYTARMEPGISAEDCLYADLGIDPGQFGCQHYEASQFMFYRRRIDPTAYMILWQVGVAGDRSLSLRETGQAYRQLLLEQLFADYPQDHPVTLYEAATLPIEQPRIQHLPLSSLMQAELTLESTLVIPPAMSMIRNNEMMRRISKLQSNLTQTPLNHEEAL